MTGDAMKAAQVRAFAGDARTLHSGRRYGRTVVRL